MSKAHLFLIIAILAEVIATAALKATEGFTKVVPSLIVIVGYCLSFYMLSLTLNHLAVGIVYAIWSGVGIVLITMLGYFVYDQKIDLPAALGIGLIMLGVIIINLYSTTPVE